MAATPESGSLLIADLTGYTAYLSRGELEHAPTIAGDLLETIVGRLAPPFRPAQTPPAGRPRAGPDVRRRPAGDDRRPARTAVPPGQVRGRCGVPVRGRRSCGPLAPARLDRGALRRLPTPPAEHRAGHDVRLQRVQPGPEAGPEVLRPPRPVRPEPDRRP